MNILIPHTWLLEHLETDATPSEIQRFLSLCGPSVERIYEREGDSVYDIEVTTNRVDCMSVRGIAREAAVILPQFGKKAKLKPLQLSKVVTETPVAEMSLAETRRVAKGQVRFPSVSTDPNLCQRTLGVVLTNATRSTTPEWMAKRLRQIEQNVHDVVIDITNYITHELGHPCHAFDYDRIMSLGGSIIITTARKGKKFVTLDGETYTTVGGEVVFENDDGEIIDLPGIKGTQNSSIQADTVNVLLWIESITPSKIRFASMTHTIRTVAAQLNEKDIDPSLAPPVLLYGMELFTQLSGAQIASPIFDDYPGARVTTPVKLPLHRVTEYLGIELSTDQIGSILEKLGCTVELVTTGRGKKITPKEAAQTALIVTPPHFRRDLLIPADLIEEVARIYGYHNLPSIVMSTAIPLLRPEGTNFTIETRLKRFLAHIGWQEIYSYSMVSESIAIESGYPASDHLKLANPLTDDRTYLRRSLLPSLREVLHQNPTESSIQVFECANIYPPQEKGLPAETYCLSLLSQRPYQEVRGSLEALLRELFVENVVITPKAQFSSLFSQAAGIAAIDKKGTAHQIGTLGVLATGEVGIELIVAELIAVTQTHPKYQPLPKTNELKEDMTFTLPAQTEVGPILTALQQLSPRIRAVTVKDAYQQNVTFSINYHDDTQNLTSEEVAPVRRAMATLLTDKFHAQLVGQLRVE